MARGLEQAWYGARAPLLLQPLALVYRAIVLARRLAFQTGLRSASHPGVPTVVVGNLTVGGAGKTPLVLWLAQRLRERGRRPGIVLRGYGGRQRRPQLVQPQAEATAVGDEALLLARRAGCPVATGVRRAAAARLLVQAGCDIVIADDGLQHLALQRDLEVVVIDGARGFGNGALLPAGPLREPVSRLRTAEFIVLHGGDRHHLLTAQARTLHMRLLPVALRELDGDRPVALEALRGKVVHALAGIGHPQRFFALLRELGATPVEHPRPDHHAPLAADLQSRAGQWIVMTEKDAVKCRALAAGRNDLYYLQVTATLPDADATRLLDRVLALRRK